jgi:hypothetical protein
LSLSARLTGTDWCGWWASASALQAHRATDFRAQIPWANDRSRDYANASVEVLEETYLIG